MGGGGQGGCERRFEAFVIIQKKNWGGGGGRGGCDQRIEVFLKVQKNKNSGGGGGWSGWVGGGGGVR